LSASVTKSQPNAPAIIREADITPGTAAAKPWAIRLDNLGKRYRLGQSNALNDNFREDLLWWLRSKAKSVAGRRRAPDPKDSFWALRHISLEVGRGETVGIIGRNGAGKSTMLKLLSRITAPTEGTIRYRGRLASLLEVGTGFHRELSGRENIYLNGAILGMTRAEIDRAFDAIVDFAGVQKFLETPVKRYSSGMYVRLAFAVAAHLRTDILVVDEVLAVGDAEFQKKCLGKMKDVASDGRTVFFVSHNMGAVQTLCSRAILLREGRLVEDGSADAVATTYLQALASRAAIPVGERTDREGDGSARCHRIWFEGPDGAPVENAASGLPLVIAFEFETRDASANHQFQFGLYDESGLCLAHVSTMYVAPARGSISGHRVARCRLDDLPLPPGVYHLNTSIVREGGARADRVERAAALHVESGPFYESGKLPPSSAGRFLLRYQWQVDNP
jgi:lipopolysaccharide transport system ATP-binding protein